MVLIMKKIFTVFLTITALICSMFTVVVSAQTTDGYMTFTADTPYFTDKPLEALPLTYEAMVYYPADYVSNGNLDMVLGNYTVARNSSVTFYINSTGYPKILIRDKGETETTKYEFHFNDVCAYTGEWMHIAVTLNPETGNHCCYVNGELKQTVSKQIPSEVKFEYNTAIGSRVQEHFRGRLRNVAIFSDIRTAEEIKADYEGTIDKDNLMAYYDLSGITPGSYPTVIPDISGNNKNANKLWLTDDEKEPVSDYAYSFALIPDTQHITRLYPDKLSSIYDYLLNNAEKKKIKFAFGLGDITDSDTETEWTLAKEQIHRLDNVIPYSILRGNHDGIEGYTTAFPYSDYEDVVDGYYADMRNTYQTFEVGDIKYLSLVIDWNAWDAVYNWAEEVIKSHPYHNVIITTHSYMDENGNHISEKADNVWNRLAYPNENVVMIVCGHIFSQDVIVKKDTGAAGNTVTQILTDPQYVDRDVEPAGVVTMLYFSEDGKNVSVEHYSTIKDMYLKEKNQFNMTVDVVDAERELGAEDYLRFTLDETKREASITGYTELMTEDKLKNLVIPEKLVIGGNEYTVTQIGGFKDNTGIETVTLPTQMTTITASAFQNCTKLKSINFPASLKTVGNAAFYGCANLSEADLSATSLTKIGQDVFRNSGLQSVKFPATLITIDKYAFQSSKVKSVDLSFTSLTSVGNTAFRNTPITTLKLPGTLEAIWAHAFRACSSLTTVTMPSCVTINDSAFQGCTNLTYMNSEYEGEGVLPSNLETIGKLAFYNIDRIKTFILPKTVKTVGTEAFTGDDILKNMYITKAIDVSTLAMVTNKINVFASKDSEVAKYAATDGGAKLYNLIPEESDIILFDNMFTDANGEDLTTFENASGITSKSAVFNSRVFNVGDSEQKLCGIIAVYSLDNTLKAVDTYSFTVPANSGVTVTDELILENVDFADGDTVKVMLWEDLENIRRVVTREFALFE